MPIDAFTSDTYDGAEFKGLDYCLFFEGSNHVL